MAIEIKKTDGRHQPSFGWAWNMVGRPDRFRPLNSIRGSRPHQLSVIELEPLTINQS